MALIGEAWTEVSDCLLNAKPIPQKYQDHSLQGDWAGFRDCHIKPDLVLIYKINDGVVELHRLATHSELFG
ncbi:type II toxin-antitoxin system YafQ family toxin [Moraxella lacunata]|uniref:type II toxin-antitoxin system YafQ family toxin n=1 Tax=Moraxella lacunata TaxID=477 RepID=UPI00215D7977|nr:type II toxin-antitoxin system YafQ family toxin [Moraxella lacunata]